MRGLGAIASGIVATALALAGVATAGYGGPPPPDDDGGGGGASEARVNAEGNAFTGGLAFDPNDVTVRLKGLVRWVNTDSVAPHTATEDHGLWRLAGDYGEPLVTGGFGPGESRQRRFDAGTFSYFCEVHPGPMHGIVRVPVRLRDKRRGKRFVVKARWGHEDLPKGQAFDVQRRKRGRDWRTVRDGTRKLKGRFPGGKEGTRWRFRARVRMRADRSAASGYSPVAKVKVG
jgi:plastocyanin